MHNRPYNRRGDETPFILSEKLPSSLSNDTLNLKGFRIADKIPRSATTTPLDTISHL